MTCVLACLTIALLVRVLRHAAFRFLKQLHVRRYRADYSCASAGAWLLESIFSMCFVPSIYSFLGGHRAMKRRGRRAAVNGHYSSIFLNVSRILMESVEGFFFPISCIQVSRKVNVQGVSGQFESLP
jgi:hypothetical protein